MRSLIMYKIKKNFCFQSDKKRNYYCILFEGLFNTLGTDVLGMTTIVPLFLAEFGASLTLIGSLSSMQSILHGITPLLAGGFIAAAASKKSLSLLLNGISRGSVLLIPFLLLLRFPDSVIVGSFFMVMLLYFCFQSMSSIIWNHLLGDCVAGKRRGQLVGTLFAVSGLITFLSSNLIKIIRDTPDLDRWTKYGIIFGLAGILLTSSVLCFIPLKEEAVGASLKEEHNVKVYLGELFRCFRSRDFNWLLITNCLSHTSSMINTFIYLYAQNFLRLPSTQVSTLLVIQTLGVIAGGFSTGRISSRFGCKCMLIFAESLELFVPICNLTAMHTQLPFYTMCAAVFFFGFSKSGYMGYQTHLLEIVPAAKKVYHIVCKSLVMLPLSLVSTLVGYVLQQAAGGNVFAVRPVYIVQILVIVLTIVSASRLKLVVYPNTQAK